MLVAAWLGQGTVHLLVRKGKVAMTLTYILAAALSAIDTAGDVCPADRSPDRLRCHPSASEQYKEIMTRGGFIILLTILLNLYGTVTLVGGALYSAYLFWRKEILPNRMFGSILIAIGGTFTCHGRVVSQGWPF